MLGVWVASAVILVPEPVGVNEYPFSGVTKSGRVWRRVQESDVRSVAPVSYTHLTLPTRFAV